MFPRSHSVIVYESELLPNKSESLQRRTSDEENWWAIKVKFVGMKWNSSIIFRSLFSLWLEALGKHSHTPPWYIWTMQYCMYVYSIIIYFLIGKDLRKSNSANGTTVKGIHTLASDITWSKSQWIKNSEKTPNSHHYYSYRLRHICWGAHAKQQEKFHVHFYYKSILITHETMSNGMRGCCVRGRNVLNGIIYIALHWYKRPNVQIYRQEHW